MLFKDRHLIRVAVVMWGSVRRITAAPTGRQLSSEQATQDTGLYYTEYTVLCSECTGRVMTRMCCSHLCSQRLSLMWRLRADRWSSRQHRTSSDMICLTQLFRDACQDAFRSRSHVKPAESLESRPSAKPSCSHTEHRAVRWDQPQIYHQSSQEFVENVLLTPLRQTTACAWFLLLELQQFIHQSTVWLISTWLDKSDWRISFSIKE